MADRIPLLLGAALASAAVAMGAPAPASAREPDITGFWMPRGIFFQQRPGTSPIPPWEPGGFYYWRDPPLTPWADKIYRDAKTREMQGEVIGEASAFCLPYGMPAFWLWGAIDITHRFGPGGAVSKYTMHSWSERQTPRHIWLDGRGHPQGEDLYPQSNGHAVGHWEGETLVIDTVGFDETVMLTPDHIPRSAEAHIVERLHLEKDGAVMVNEMTISDPKVFTQPWKLRFELHRVADKDEQFEQACDPRRRGSWGAPSAFPGGAMQNYGPKDQRR